MITHKSDEIITPGSWKTIRSFPWRSFCTISLKTRSVKTGTLELAMSFARVVGISPKHCTSQRVKSGLRIRALSRSAVPSSFAGRMYIFFSWLRKLNNERQDIC